MYLQFNKINAVFPLRFLLTLYLITVLNYTASSQIIDTVLQNEIQIYHVENYQENSWLYWEADGGEILSENPTQSDSIVVEWTTPDIGTLSVYEISDMGCMGEVRTVEVEIQMDTNVKLDIPNTFTPNGDGLNDYFTISYNIIPENYLLTIYNRWGELVFETHNINKSWDGKHKGRKCNDGTYFYIINYSANGKTHTKKGFISLF